MSIGDRIEHERKRLGLSQTAFSKAVGVSLSSQKRYESGEREPDTAYLERARKIGVDISFLLTNTRRGPSGIDGDNWIDFGICFAQILGFTSGDLRSVLATVSATMAHENYRHLEPDDSVAAYDAVFLKEVLSLVNRKNSVMPLGKDSIDIDTNLLSAILENLETAAGSTARNLSAKKKALIVGMLYRNFKASGTVDLAAIRDAIAIAE